MADLLQYRLHFGIKAKAASDERLQPQEEGLLFPCGGCRSALPAGQEWRPGGVALRRCGSGLRLRVPRSPTGAGLEGMVLPFHFLSCRLLQ